MSKDMTRIQILLDPGMKEELENLALELNISKSELIRQSIRRIIKEKESKGYPLLGIIALGRSNTDDASEKHDKYLAEE